MKHQGVITTLKVAQNFTGETLFCVIGKTLFIIFGNCEYQTCWIMLIVLQEKTTLAM